MEDKVRSGKYQNALEVVSESLQLLDARDRHEQLKAAIATGNEQLRRGEGIPWTADSMSENLREVDEEDRRGLLNSDDVKP